MIQIGIIGPNTSLCSKSLYAFGYSLGKAISERKRVIICGGMGGFMEAVCKGFKASGTGLGQTVGILPSIDPGDVNPFIDIAIPTGMGAWRNRLIVQSADFLIAAAGGAGTLSELAMAWQMNRHVLCITGFGGWSEELAGSDVDQRHSGLFIPISTIGDATDHIEAFETRLRPPHE